MRAPSQAMHSKLWTRRFGPAFRSTFLPRRTRHHRWVAAAAAVTLVVAGYGWWQHSETIVPEPADHQATIASFDFEGGMAATEEDVVLDRGPAGDRRRSRPADKDDGMLSSADLEDGDLGSLGNPHLTGPARTLPAETQNKTTVGLSGPAFRVWRIQWFDA